MEIVNIRLNLYENTQCNLQKYSSYGSNHNNTKYY